MRLLLDQNLSFRLLPSLSSVFPDSAHVRTFGLESAADSEIWDYARANGYTILTKDSDFLNRSLLDGAPPKVIHVRVGNCSTDRIRSLLEKRSDLIAQFLQDSGSTLLIIDI